MAVLELVVPPVAVLELVVPPVAVLELVVPPVADVVSEVASEQAMVAQRITVRRKWFMSKKYTTWTGGLQPCFWRLLCLLEWRLCRPPFWTAHSEPSRAGLSMLLLSPEPFGLPS
jgi:hypothetical protein